MTGITSILSHLITVVLLWVAFVLIVQCIKYFILRESSKLGEANKQNKKNISRLVSFVNAGATVVVLIVVLLIMFFLYNPTERSYEEMDKIGTIVPEIIEPTEDEIKASNKEVMERKSVEKEKEAEQDNIEAMEKAEKLFRKAQERADNN